MKPIFKSKTDLAKHYNFIVKTDSDNERLEKAWTIYVTNYKGDGCMGCVAEMLTATSHSKKTTVSNSGKPDSFIKYRTNTGKVIPVTVERKTNGGRIQTIETEYSKAEKMSGKYVVYSLDICNKSTGYIRRYVPAVVIPKQLFVEKLIEFNAIKPMYHNGVLDGYGIQASKKPLYLWLSEWPIVYNRDAIYCDDDFDGLE